MCTLLVIHETDGRWVIHGLGAPGVRLASDVMIGVQKGTSVTGLDIGEHITWLLLDRVHHGCITKSYPTDRPLAGARAVGPQPVALGERVPQRRVPTSPDTPATGPGARVTPGSWHDGVGLWVYYCR